MQRNQPMPNHIQGPPLAMPVSEDRDHILGPPNAPVTLVEYGDFECPHCGQAHYVLNDLMDQVDDQVRLVYRHFPLTQIHPHSQRAAEASEAAGAQGEFWDMHDMLFENQEALDDYDLVLHAQALGLDLPRFRRELLQGAYTARVREDFHSGIHSGVNGTPTFFLNGRRYDAPWDLETLLTVIEKEVARQPKPAKARGRGRAGKTGSRRHGG